jgi:hypothetical protein
MMMAMPTGPVVDTGDLGSFDIASVKMFMGSWAGANQATITTVKISIIFGGNGAGVRQWLSLTIEQSQAVVALSMIRNKKQ